jgi:dihydrofolate synthase / folylpolyglutamate synthase
MNTSKQTSSKKSAVVLGRQRSYNEVLEFLDKSWSNSHDKNLTTIKKLNTELGSPAEKLKTIFIAGTNGKSLTADFTDRLLKEEGLKVGTFSSPHILNYNERINLNNENINNKSFTDIANEVINATETLKINAHGLELLTMIAILWFWKNKVDVAILEVPNSKWWDAVNICKPNVVAITRLIWDNEDQDYIEKHIKEVTDIIKKDTQVVSADQNKLNLQLIEKHTEKAKGEWAMPIRKLANLSYPFEQLHGRCAALAERAAQMFLSKFVISKETTIVCDSLLIKPKGQRGRPTREAKRKLEQTPQKTIESFWKETHTTLPGRFQLLEKEKPTLLLDNADNLDAFSNLLLGIRLLHYRRTLKGLVIIVGCEKNDLQDNEFLKTIRYFFKKTSGQIIFCPTKPNVFIQNNNWDTEKITNDAKNLKIKAKAAKNFVDAFDTAKKLVDDRNGLVVITGSRSIISEYWENKGIKKI